MSEIKVIGFDLDNTLYPSTPEIQRRIRGEIYRLVSEQVGISPEVAKDLFEEFYNSDRKEYGHSGTRSIAEIARRQGTKVKGDIVQEAVENADFLDLIEPNPQLRAMLERLQEERGLDLLTGSRRDLVLGKLDRIGLSYHLFDNVIISGEHGSKRNGDAYLYWLSLRALPADQLLYVGDNRVQDIEVPKGLGIKTCFVGEEQTEADFHIRDILELEERLRMLAL